VANGVVYVTGPVTKRGIDAFSATCATGGRTCSPLWHGSGLVASDPAVAGGEVWATVGPPTGPDKLYAFGLPGPGRSVTATNWAAYNRPDSWH
jgi:hypothetical protein